jgi:hypothetical protein
MLDKLSDADRIIAQPASRRSRVQFRIARVRYVVGKSGTGAVFPPSTSAFPYHLTFHTRHRLHLPGLVHRPVSSRCTKGLLSHPVSSIIITNWQECGKIGDLNEYDELRGTENIRNHSIREELAIFDIVRDVVNYGMNWSCHLIRIGESRFDRTI